MKLLTNIGNAFVSMSAKWHGRSPTALWSSTVPNLRDFWWCPRVNQQDQWPSGGVSTLFLLWYFLRSEFLAVYFTESQKNFLGRA